MAHTKHQAEQEINWQVQRRALRHEHPAVMAFLAHEEERIQWFDRYPITERRAFGRQQAIERRDIYTLHLIGFDAAQPQEAKQ